MSDLISCLNSAMATYKALKLRDWRGIAKVQECFLPFSGGWKQRGFLANK